MSPTCTHPTKPWEPPSTMTTCGCGQNAICPTCGFGWGSSPCECDGDMNAFQFTRRRDDGIQIAEITLEAGTQ